jgi:hypothetical protein
LMCRCRVPLSARFTPILRSFYTDFSPDFLCLGRKLGGTGSARRCFPAA